LYLSRSAAARAGKSVLQLDGSQRFGGEWGTLALDEFVDWVRRRSEDDDGGGDENDAAVSTPTPTPSTGSSSEQAEERRVSFLSASSSSSSASPPSSSSSIYLNPRFEREELRGGDAAAKAKPRSFALDISPKLLYCDGSTVNALLAAGAASYAEFKLVGAHLVWVREDGDGERDGNGKEERELAPSSSSTSISTTTSRGRLLPLPASRADIFMDRSMPLAAKRSVMRFLQQAADAVLGKGGPLAPVLSVSPSKVDSSSSSSSSSSTPFAAVVASANLPRGAADAVLYGLAGADADQGPWENGELMTKEAAVEEAETTTTTTDSTTTESTAATRATTAATRATTAPSSAPWASAPLPCSAAALSLRRHLLSLGRYGGSSALLCPVYGSGELPQAFVRSSAVAGGAAALRRKVVAAFVKRSKTEGNQEATSVTAVELSSGQRLECRALAGEWKKLRALLVSGSGFSSSSPATLPPLLPRVARCVAVLDGPPALSSASGSGSAASNASSAASSSSAPALLSAATAALVFPPRCLDGKTHPRNSVRGLLSGSATASTPEGRWVLHLSTPLPTSGEEQEEEEEQRKGEKANERTAAERALFGALSALARPPEGCGPSLSSSLAQPPRALDHRPSALLAAFFEVDAGPDETERGDRSSSPGSLSSSSSSFPRNAAATAPPDGRQSADDGALASARAALERLFPGEGVEKLLLEKQKKKKKKGEEEEEKDKGAEEGEEEKNGSAEAEGGDDEEEDCSSDEDAASDLAAVLAELDAHNEG